MANELSELYKIYIDEYFKAKVLSKVNETFTVTDLLHLYFSYDFYKKSAIKKIYEIESYDELVKYSDSYYQQYKGGHLLLYCKQKFCFDIQIVIQKNKGVDIS